VRYLHRHPTEIDLDLDQIAEIAVIGQEIENHQAEMAGAIFGGVG
jgi:hypothetical protein